MKKNRIAMIAMAVALTAGGSLVTALPAAADPPDGSCPMLNGITRSEAIENISDQGVNSLLLACKRWTLHGQ